MARSRGSQAMRDWQRMMEERPERNRKARWDIQGLRAFAVTAVVLDHLLKWPKGGFVGVDVFFVISGFLITGLLVREHEKTGHISFVGFYRRRIKRIIPAAVLVLIVTVVVSHQIFNTVRAHSIRTDAIWAFLFGANWHFRAIGTDYFTANNAISPLQHYWSLSIEEQFYFVWPWVMLAIFALLLGRRVSFNAARTVIFAVITAATVASFLWALHETSANATGAYFSTFSRAWELGLGAMCAVAAPMLHRIPDGIRPVLAWIGLATMTASLFMVSSDKGFPAPWAALPVVATALVIAAGTHPEKGWQQPTLFPLTNPVSTYVGDVSYSLYLWHFPIIILGEAQLGVTSKDKLILALTMGLAAVFSYHLVEDPIRQSTLWEMTRQKRHDRRAAYFPTVSGAAFGNTLLAFFVCLALGASAYALRPAGAPGYAGPASLATNAVIDSAKPVKLNGPDLDAAVSREVAAGLKSAAWPSIVIGGSLKTIQAPQLSSGCFNGFDDYTKTCTTTGTSKHTAVILGDSVAMSWVPVLQAALPTWTISTFGKYSCPFAHVLVSYPEGPKYTKCLDYQAKAIAAIQQMHPDLVFLATADYPFSKLSDGATGSKAQYEWVTGGLDTVAKVTQGSTQAVILRPPPSVTSLVDCATRSNTPRDCEGKASSNATNMGTALTAIAAQSNGKATYIDTIDWFCDGDRCPVVIGGTPVRVDGDHISVPYGQHIAPNLLARLQKGFPALLLGR